MAYVITYKDHSGVGHRLSLKSAEMAWVRLVRIENSRATSIIIFKGVQQLTRQDLWDEYAKERAANPNWEFEVQVQGILREHWDPIGVGKVPEAYDEYDSYAPQIAELLRWVVSEEALMAHLLNIETETMGLSGGYSTKQAVDALTKIKP